jgi:hypothetical protein
VKNGKAIESLLAMPNTPNDMLDAISLTDLIMTTLNNASLNTDHLLSQCYDGANVMRGDKGGVQALIKQRLGRDVPYIHCFNHRLHLVIIHAVSSIPCLEQYFSQCELLYVFLRRPKVSTLYTGKNLNRLLVQRWSGHYQTTLAIVDNFSAILECLQEVSMENGVYSGDTIAEAIGLLTVMKNIRFRFSACLMKTVLGIIAPVDRILQTRESNLHQAVTLINVVKEEISALRSDEKFSEHLELSKSKSLKNYYLFLINLFYASFFLLYIFFSVEPF